MKYITTDKHPELKEGKILEWASSRGLWQIEKTAFYQLNTEQLEYQLSCKWFKEVQEPEFTKSEMIEFAQYSQQLPFLTTNKAFAKWNKEYRNK